mmetsp:Transcript_25751/g.47061  ORF Transcript_25751/g.47061 Transcript_25751/m.47061 type:complete len:207 (+) Transcript_25751:108-728(+)
MSATKTVFLIRHAESRNNVDKRETARLFRRLCRGILPSCAQLRHMLALLKVEMNSSLSSYGQAQVARQHETLSSANFIGTSGVQLIVHSPLVRAKETCSRLFPEQTVPMMEHSELFEKDIGEHLGWRRLSSRVRSFEEWLEARSESHIVIVGHSAFFRCMVPGIKPKNVEVWKAEFDAGSGVASRWSAPQLCFAGPDPTHHVEDPP